VTDNTPVATAAARLPYRCAAGELLHAARLFLGASVRLRDAAQVLDPSGTAAEDPAALALCESVAELLGLAASASPGTRLLFVEAVERSMGPAASQPES